MQLSSINQKARSLFRRRKPAVLSSESFAKKKDRSRGDRRVKARGRRTYARCYYVGAFCSSGSRARPAFRLQHGPSRSINAPIFGRLNPPQVHRAQNAPGGPFDRVGSGFIVSSHAEARGRRTPRHINSHLLEGIFWERLPSPGWKALRIYRGSHASFCSHPEARQHFAAARAVVIIRAPPAPPPAFIPRGPA